jgi:hypothetical protein
LVREFCGGESSQPLFFVLESNARLKALTSVALTHSEKPGALVAAVRSPLILIVVLTARFSEFRPSVVATHAFDVVNLFFDRPRSCHPKPREAVRAIQNFINLYLNVAIGTDIAGHISDVAPVVRGNAPSEDACFRIVVE